MTNHHDQHFLEPLIGWEMSGSPTSFYTWSLKIEMTTCKHVKKWMRKWHGTNIESLHAWKQIKFGDHLDFMAREPKWGVLATKKNKKTKHYVKEISICRDTHFYKSSFLVILKIDFVKNTMSWSKSTVHYDMWPRPLNCDVEFSWSWSLVYQPWPQ